MSEDQKESIEIEKQKFREILRNQYGVKTLLVHVRVIARILGVSPDTLYGHIRNNVFFMEYRLLNRTPVIEVEKFVNWYCTNPAMNHPKPIPIPKKKEIVEEDLLKRVSEKVLIEMKRSPLRRMRR